MRTALLVSVGVLLFAGGVGVGVLLHRGGAPGRPDAAGAEPNGGGVKMAAKKTGKSAPTLEDDRKGICGLWRYTGESANGVPVLIFFSPDDLFLSAFDEEGNIRLLGYALEERDGARVVVATYYEDGAVFFRYQLDGDRLEFFTPSPAAPAEWGQNLEGVWRRLR